MSQIVTVVSMDEAPILFGSWSFQSKEVRGAQYSDDLVCVILYVMYVIRLDFAMRVYVEGAAFGLYS